MLIDEAFNAVRLIEFMASLIKEKIEVFYLPSYSPERVMFYSQNLRLRYAV
jgi:uncharacterized secreted protein with C-terminal beta-propeller domain